jgi:hypothetical protein
MPMDVVGKDWRRTVKKSKRISFLLPISMWEELYRMFPEQGARSILMRMLVGKLIELGPDINEKVKQGILECVPEEGEE